jgi:ABC-type glycerol-3-phosphate transport system permease component
MAASTNCIIPPILFFLLLRRRTARGLVAGAVKG